jgi:hypothetical protein
MIQDFQVWAVTYEARARSVWVQEKTAFTLKDEAESFILFLKELPRSYRKVSDPIPFVRKTTLGYVASLSEELLVERLETIKAIQWFEDHGWGKISEFCQSLLSGQLRDATGVDKKHAALLFNLLEEDTAR